MDVFEMVKLYNEGNKTLKEIGDLIGKSKSTIQRMFSNAGYVYHKSTNKYIDKELYNLSDEEFGKHIDELKNNVSRETVNTGNSKNIKMVKCTFDVPEQLHRKLKSKCALDGVKMTEFIRKLLEDALNV